MARVTDNEEIEYIINVGDNFYKHGIDSETSPRWQTTFESVYDAPNLKPLLWYTIGEFGVLAYVTRQFKIGCADF
jgi:hypothetical protein